MANHNTKNPLEVAAFVVELGSPSSYVDAAATGGGVTWKPRAYCAHCHGHGCLIRITNEKGKKAFHCNRCGNESSRCAMLKPAGFSLKQTRASSRTDLADIAADIDVTGIMRAMRGCSPESVLWFKFAHTSSPDTNAETKIFAAIVSTYSETVGRVTLSESVRYFNLIDLFIQSSRPGAKATSLNDYAKAINVNRSQFSSGRSWDLILQNISDIARRWRCEVEDAVSKYCD